MYRETRAMLNVAEVPPVSVLASSLINELDQVEKTFILVLDDYHFVRQNAVHELLSELLKHPTGPMHLVLATRRDPPLPLATLRARSRMTEIRVQELRFSVAESAAFLQKVTGRSVDDTIAAVLEEKTEGWVTGLRLAALSLRYRSNMDRILAQLPENNRYVMDYIVAEVLSQQPSAIQEYLLATAILDRFCASLCQAVCVLDTESQAYEMSGQEFLDWRQRSNLFVIPIDDQYRWFRYHHLFQQLLQRRLKRRFSPDDIAALHKQAGIWFADQGLLAEAFRHTLAAGDTPAAVQLVKQHRHDLMNQEQWHRLAHWMGMLPSKIIAKSPELLISQAWSFWNRMRLPEMANVLDQAEPLLAAMSSEAEKGKELQSELFAMRS
ncbi:MAG: transcriptional regulator, partial [Thermodesulfobacteriota bacterium]|nr:transcriptional regulator [Thermodesulfobacteriota bacterium]